MRKSLWKYLLVGLLTGMLVFALAATASGSASLVATSTRWPTSTRCPTDTRWPTSTRRPTNTRWPTATRTVSKTRAPTLTRTASQTRWSTLPPTPTHTRWPSRTPSPTRTRITVPTSTPTPQTFPGPYGVVFVKSNDVLNIRSDAGANYPVVGAFDFDDSTVYRTGPSSVVGAATWVEVQNPTGGTGWVNSYYLTEVISGPAFCGDSRIASLIAQLKQAVNASNGALFASLVSPVRGVDVRLWIYQPAVHYTRSGAAGVFTSATQQNWGAGPSGIDTVGTFAAVIQPKMADLLNASYESYCNDPKATSMFAQPWPSEYVNFNYYSLFKPGTPGVDLDYRQWMIGIDYVNGQPYLVTLIHVIWEP